MKFHLICSDPHSVWNALNYLEEAKDTIKSRLVILSSTASMFDISFSSGISFVSLTAQTYLSYNSNQYITNISHPSEQHLATFTGCNLPTGTKLSQGIIPGKAPSILQ